MSFHSDQIYACFCEFSFGPDIKTSTHILAFDGFPCGPDIITDPISYPDYWLFLYGLFLAILFVLFCRQFFLGRISSRFERTEVRSLPLFLSSHSSFQLGCLHAASLQPHRASLTPLGRVRVPLVFVRVISGIPSLLSRNSVSLSLPARFVARRVALFLDLAFFFEFSSLFSLLFSPFLCSRLRFAQSSSPSACSSNTVASCRVSVLVSSALLNSRCQ